MVCCSCTWKLALRLTTNHPKLDLIRALELAEKGVIRVEQRKKAEAQSSPIIRSVTEKEMRELGFDPAYSAACSSSGTCGCQPPELPCKADFQCIDMGNCAVSCPSPPKANSHEVSDTCTVTRTQNCECVSLECTGLGSCTCGKTGLCYYDCDEGYGWNGETEQCDLLPVIDRFQEEGRDFRETKFD